MLSFVVYIQGKPASKLNLAGAYVIGSDDVPMRAEISFADGAIVCRKRSPGPAGLVLLWDVKGVGTILLDTVRVPERDRPYILQVELARARLVRIQQKLEEWGLLDGEGIEALSELIAQAREGLIEALQADNPAEAGARADEAVALAIKASEALGGHHAQAQLERRKQGTGFARRLLGFSAPPEKATDAVRKRLAGVFDFVRVPIVWRDIEPNEQAFNWKPLDAYVDFWSKHHFALKASALLSFQEKHVPDWLYIWEHDFETIRDLAFEHVRRIIHRYGQRVQAWDLISGVHANNCFTFNFEQIMELTRMAASLAKQLSPRSTAIVDLVMPWGEYYARNQRAIPPLLYADMVLQSGVPFDAFGVQLFFGPAVDGMFVRDMFQISSLLDQFARLGKPLHITAVQIPSDATVSKDAGGAAGRKTLDGGVWHGPWSEEVQAEWARAFCTIALSKPFVESITWHSLVDDPGQPVLNGGLFRADLTPKLAFTQLAKLRSELRVR